MMPDTQLPFSAIERSNIASGLDHKSLHRQAWLWFGSTAGILLVALSSTSTPQSEARSVVQLAFGVTIVALCAAGFAVSPEERRRRGGAMIGVLFPSLVGLTFGLSNLSLLLPGDLAAQSDTNVSILSKAAAVVAVGLGGWLVGYNLGGWLGFDHEGRKLGALILPPLQPDESFLGPGVAALTIGLMAKVMLLSRGAFGYLADPTALLSQASVLDGTLNLLVSLSTVGLALVAIEYFERRRFTTSVIFYGATTTELLLAIFTGGKQPVLVVGIAIAFAGLSTGKLRLGRVVVLAVLTVLLIFPLNNIYRELLRPQPGRSATPAAAISALPTAIDRSWELAGTPSEYLETAVSQGTGRTSLLGATAQVASVHDAGRAYLPITSIATRGLALMIPRAIWPSKPIDTIGLDIAWEYFGQDRSTLSAQSVTYFGDGYRHGGFWSAFVLLAYLGAIMRLLDAAFDVTVSKAHLVGLLTLASVTVKAEGDIGSFGASVLRTLVVFIPAMWLLFRFRRGKFR